MLIFRGVIGHILGPTKTLKVEYGSLHKNEWNIYPLLNRALATPAPAYTFYNLNSWSMFSYLLLLAIYICYIYVICMFYVCYMLLAQAYLGKGCGTSPI